MQCKRNFIIIVALVIFINYCSDYISDGTKLLKAADITLTNQKLLSMQIELTKEEIENYAQECSMPLGEYMSVLMAYGKWQVNEDNAKSLSKRQVVKLRNRMVRFFPEEFYKLSSIYEGLIEDLTYFPIPRSKEADSWVEYCDSWGGERTYGGERRHEGTDIMTQKNIAGVYPVIAAAAGTVTNIGWLELGGWRVGITSENGIYYYYAHLDSYADIAIGDVVMAGQLLGFAGNTGYSKVEGTKGKFDVHLHFGIYINDEKGTQIAVNPYYLLKTIENKVLYYQYRV